MIRNRSRKGVFVAALLAFFSGGLISAQAATLAAPTMAKVSITKPSASTVHWISCEWQDNSSNETGFQIRARLGNSGNFTPIETASSGATSWAFVINAFPVGTVIQFQVVAFSGPASAPTGFSAASNTAQVIVPADKFDAPSGLTATAMDGGIIELKWTDNSTTEEGFAVELRNQGEPAFTHLGNAQFNSTSVQISGFGTPGQLEEFRLRAIRGTPPAVDVSSGNATAYTPIASAKVRDLITSNSTVSVYWGEPFEMEVTTSQPDLRTGLEVASLPGGLTFDSGTNKITGVPTTPGTSTANVTATFSSLSEVVSGKIAIAILPPAVTSRPFEPATVGVPFSFEVQTSSSGVRNRFELALPSGLGLTFDSSTGVLEGTPTQAGVYVIPILATFAGYTPQVSGTLTLRVRNPAGPPADIPGASQSLSVPEGSPCTVNLSGLFYDPDAAAAARLQTNIGNIDIILYPDSTPETVSNFLKYVDAGDYDGSVFHRAIPDFIVQGGGFVPAAPGNKFFSVPARPSPVNEPGISNLRGTVAMAKIGGLPNSATTNFFFNLADNSANLDNQNAGFTAFGRVSAPGLAAMDSLAGKPTATYSAVIDGAAAQDYGEWPVNAASAPATMDNTKMLVIESARRLPVLSYALVSDPASDVVQATLSGDLLSLKGLKPGTKEIGIEITDLDGNKITRALQVTVGQGVSYYETPNQPPVNAGVFQFESGTAASLAPAVSGNETAFRWLKNGVAVPRATSPTLAFSAIKLTDAGAYRRIATLPGGEVRTAPMLVGVLEFSRQPVLAKAGSKVVLAAKVAGPGFSLVWGKDWNLLSEIPGKISGSSTPQLAIASFAASDSGTYQCVLRSAAGTGMIIPRSVVAVTGGPVIGNLYFAPVDVNHQASYQLDWDTGQSVAPVKFAVTGLPAGMAFNSLTGLISGCPTVPGTYTLTVTGTNAFGTSQKKTFSLTVNAVPSGSTGTFVGVVPRDIALDGGLGGLLTVTVGANGVYTGKIVLGTASYAFNGIIVTAAGLSPQIGKTITRTDSSQVRLEVTLNAGILAATLTGGAASATIAGAKTVAPAAALAGIYTSRFSIPAADANSGNIDLVPQGHGFASLTVGATGRISITGKLADGTALLTSSSFGFGGKVPMHVVLPSKKDFLLGAATITQASAAATPQLTGTAQWGVAPGTSAKLVYPAAFGPQSLEWVGARYVAPAAGKIILGLADKADNADLSFFDANLDSEKTNRDPDVTLRIKTDNSVVMPAAHPAFVTLKIDPAKGAFSGTFQFTDTVAGKPVIRKPSFQGLLINGSGGFGYFILPQLPSSVRQPGLSGAVELAAPTPTPVP